MANWDDIINNRLTMGRVRQLCYAMNAARRRRENGEQERRPGVMPLLGRGIRPVVLQFQHWDGFPEENYNYNYSIRERSGHSLHLNHIWKLEDSPIAYHIAWQLDLAMWLPTPGSPKIKLPTTPCPQPTSLCTTPSSRSNRFQD